jgi:hypothetical protein
VIDRLGLTEAQAKAKNRSLLKTYNITLEEYAAILDIQGWRCAVCERQHAPGVLFCVDHEHLSKGEGPVRGILCFRCNRYKVGNLSLSEAKRISQYLECPPARKIVGIRNGKKTQKYRRRRRPK